MDSRLTATFFEDLGAYSRFFMTLREACVANEDGSIAKLEKEGERYCYTLSDASGLYVGEYLWPFRATEKNLRLFHGGCAEIARRLQIALDTGDPEQVPQKPPAFGMLSCEFRDVPPAGLADAAQTNTELAYFPEVIASRMVRRYRVDPYGLVLLTDVKCAGIIQCSHLFTCSESDAKNVVLVIAAEVNNLGQPGDGSHVLACYTGSKHINLGVSNEWADLACFHQRAIEIARERLGVKIE